MLVTGAWSETSITWSTKPALATTVAQGRTRWDANASYTWDATSVVTGNGTISLALIGNVTDQVTANSREQASAGSAAKPTLIVSTCGGASSPTTTPGPTATPAGTATPTPTSTPSSGGVTLVAVGDIACAPGKTQDATHCQQQATANTAAQSGPGAVLNLGDNQYECGSSAEFAGSYNSSWGQLKGITYPVVGNHEYNWGDGVNPPCPGMSMPNGAEGYWNYFGDAATPLQPGCRSNCLGYYSFDVGDWHVVVLNSMLCGPLGSNQCYAGSAQQKWLQNDLQNRSSQCVLAAWHHPLFSTNERAPGTKPLWDTLYANGAEIVLNGHLHRYEQFGPQDGSGNASAYGMREFVVGTGGKNFQGWNGRGAANLEVVDDTSFGVLRLSLRSDGYSWQFVPAAGGQFSTSGSDSCHGAPGSASATESSPQAVHAFTMVMDLPNKSVQRSTRRRLGRQAICRWSHAHYACRTASVIRPRISDLFESLECRRKRGSSGHADYGKARN